MREQSSAGGGGVPLHPRQQSEYRIDGSTRLVECSGRHEQAGDLMRTEKVSAFSSQPPDASKISIRASQPQHFASKRRI
jgi:hypothetical protein